MVIFADARQPKPRPVPERYFNGSRSIHLCWDKDGLIRQLRKHGVRGVITSSKPITVDEAIDWVRAFPTTEAIPFGECDDFDFAGHCNGHPTEESDPNARPVHLLPPDPDFPTSIRRPPALEASTGAAEPTPQGSSTP